LSSQSNASQAAAGIRNGDEVTQPVPQDLIQAKQNAILTLKLLRDGEPLEISYLPRGETVEAYQWIEKSCTEAPSYQ